MNKGCAQCCGGLGVSACATTHQQWGLMFPIPFPGPTATEGWWGAALPQAAAVGLACSPTTGTFRVAHVRPAAEVSREFSQSSLSLSHCCSCLALLRACAEPASPGVCRWLPALLTLAGLGLNFIRCDGGNAPGGWHCCCPRCLAMLTEGLAALCPSSEPCLTMTGPGTAACPARGSASPTGTSCTSSTPRMTSGGRPGWSQPTARVSRSGSSPARRGECPSAELSHSVSPGFP